VHLGTREVGPGATTRVAIKRLRPELAHDERAATSLMDEAKIAARIVHPNVVTILDVVRTEEDLYIVMEYIEGASLSALLGDAASRGERIPISIACALVLDVLAGLHAAHESRDADGAALGVIHRDVSPQNILVGSDGRARVLDFGIAKAIGRSYETMRHEIRGKPSYMAPEQLRRGEVDRRVDVWAAGVVAWEVLTGERLFRGASERDCVMKVLRLDVPAPSSRVPTVPAAIDAVVLRALARDPALRFPTTAAMAADLARAAPVAPPADRLAWALRGTGPLLERQRLSIEETMSEGTTLTLPSD